ncbi:YebC/PmpR family DNA-binding transcriptional regulator [Francisella philomiragia]|uniref:Probable transcriptional regulatory protein Fphi_1565 n=1 Tax=Francisella philomiragia subsp. philomiragia (strain ATCC 25017 / CCUG 19701 / FSC 153 / O\|nr:YebC/PmpR family DNA-binding transcriptional regulator [Francisella philomiragia]B0TZD8.1 RecName: Full=Probable transcriptional regulatory protein Fphi_1565 [Francisella philomiragia subsp. philomiragia ATCC 25017]AJI47381.1 DNA-binding regulatory, YebC/PmpR family protein [Francisella philomiragia]AJI49402.1 DNA-binding regulatory, YebC/PmpR family protein [Francisella philomiragia]AJI56089.1 DNA-binding regulatory, YebC/PmpR family protein [Francisella philomiragia]MBK2020893.1 YebC/PmpR
MAGHSKWANIKHKKAKEDAKRGKIFTKLIREITVAARLGGGDKDANPRLRAAIATAFANNMSKDTVERAILKGAGGDDSANVEEVRYEGYGPGGVAIIVDCMTDNRNRTVGEVRHAFTKSGGNLGTDGSVAYMFTKKGIISFAPGVDEDALMEVALEAGAEDIITHEDGSIDVFTTPHDFSDVQEALIAKGFNSDNAEVTFDAETKAELDIEIAEKVMNLIDRLEDLDDVQNVYSNVNFTQELMEQLG